MIHICNSSSYMYLEPIADGACVACGHDDGIKLLFKTVHKYCPIFSELLNSWHHLDSTKHIHLNIIN